MENDFKTLRYSAKRFMKFYDDHNTSSYVNTNCGEEVKELLRQADMLLGNTFIFTDRWDMEPCASPYTISLDSWTESPNGDPEWVFMLNRHDFLQKLWQAYLLTGNKSYVLKLKMLMLDWIEKNPITISGTAATRTIDTGIRCMNWCTLLLPMLALDVLTDEDALKIIDSLREQFLNMKDRYIRKYSLSNWGVLQTTAICVGYLWFSDYLPEGLEEWAWEELRNQLELHRIFHTRTVFLAEKLCSKNTRTRHSTENAEIKNYHKLINDGNT